MLHHCLALHTPVFGIPARHASPQASLSGGILHLYHHFAGYMLAGVLSLFIMLRVVHGLAFGMVTVAGNTIVIDITPSSRRGEAVGYYGLMNNTAMSFGPMIGLSCMTYIPLKRFLPARSYQELSVLLPHASSRPHPNNQSNENLSHWTALCC